MLSCSGQLTLALDPNPTLTLALTPTLTPTLTLSGPDPDPNQVRTELLGGAALKTLYGVPLDGASLLSLTSQYLAAMNTPGVVPQTLTLVPAYSRAG